MVVTIRAGVAGDERALALVGKATFLETYAARWNGATPSPTRHGG